MRDGGPTILHNPSKTVIPSLNPSYTTIYYLVYFTLLSSYVNPLPDIIA